MLDEIYLEMCGDELAVEGGLNLQLLFCEVEEDGQFPPAGQLRAGLTQLVEEGVGTGLGEGWIEEDKREGRR